MTTALTGAVELLERSLGYTRVQLAAVTDDDLDRPTPCADWDLAALLAHMEDALDAFTEAAGGTLQRSQGAAAAPRVDRIRDKACALLGVWSSPPPPGVDVAGHAVTTELLLATASLEITVHGWDVGRSLGHDHRIPDPLAEHLLGLAGVLVHPSDRVVRFGAPTGAPENAPAGDRLLAWLGRTA